MKRRFLLFTAIIVAVSAVTAISFAQRKPDTADKPITGDFKITIRNMAGGQSSQSTTMIKGKRERSESSTGGMSTSNVSITQCDLRRRAKRDVWFYGPAFEKDDDLTDVT